MGRYVKDIRLGLPEDEVQNVIQRFLSTNNFVLKQNFERAPYYVLGENAVRSYGFFQYHYKDGSLHIEAYLGLNNVESGLTGWSSAVEKSTYLQKIHQLIEEVLALLPAGNPVAVAMYKELAGERNKSRAGMALFVVLLCVFVLMMAVSKMI